MRPLLIVLAAAILMAPVFIVRPDGSPLMSAAYADDDDDDDDGGSVSGSPGSSGPSDWRGRTPAPSSRGWRFPRLFGFPQRPTRPRAQQPPAAVPNEIVVAEVSGAELDQLIADGFTVVARAPLSLLQGEIARLNAPEGVDFDTARDRILGVSPAAVVDANHLYRPVEMPCEQGNCPAFEMIGWVVPPVRCDVPVTIGMIDTVVNREHEALRKQAVEIVSVIADGEKTSAAVHGTAIAALLVGDHASRTPGLLPDASLIAVEAFHRDGAGDAADVFKIVRGLNALSERGVRVVNMSFAGPANTVLQRAVEAAHAGSDMILVSAAGNKGPKAPAAYPAAFPGVIAVTAIDRTQRVYRQAGTGDHIDFAAPGVRVWTAASVSGGRFRSGTSYAAPFVSAAIAASLAQEPDRTAKEIVDSLAAGADDLGEVGRDPVFGWGLIKAVPPCQ